MFDGGTLSFDVTIDLTDDIVPPGVRPHQAVHRVRAAVEAMPGAGWVSVDYFGLIPPGLPWIVLYEAGCVLTLEPALTGDLAARIEATVRVALD